MFFGKPRQVSPSRQWYNKQDIDALGKVDGEIVDLSLINSIRSRDFRTLT